MYNLDSYIRSSKDEKMDAEIFQKGKKNIKRASSMNC